MISGGLKKLRPLHELSSEPAIRSNNTGQWTPYFDCCHLTITWIFLHTLDSYNPGQTSLGQWSSIRNFLSFLDVLIKQCNLLKRACNSPSSPIISVWHGSRYKPGMEVEDAKRMVRDAIGARIFNDMVSLIYVLPSHHPMQNWNSRKILFFVGWGEGLGMYDNEQSPTNASLT